MGVALYIVLDRDDPGFDTFVDGKAVAKETKNLDAISKKLGIPTFGSFISMSSGDLEGVLGDEVEVPPQTVKWFSADDGLKFIEALTTHILANPTSVKNQSAVLEDLGEYAEVLGKIKEIGAKWHLNIDI